MISRTRRFSFSESNHNNDDDAPDENSHVEAGEHATEKEREQK